MKILYIGATLVLLFIIPLHSIEGQEIKAPGDSLITSSKQQIQSHSKNLLDGVIFDSGSSLLDARSEKVLLKALSRMLDKPTLQVEIVGYTDNKGSSVANMNLSRQRADAVKNWLVSKGIDSSRIKAKGLGSINPIASNETPLGRSKNRRIEFVEVN